MFHNKASRSKQHLEGTVTLDISFLYLLRTLQ